MEFNPRHAAAVTRSDTWNDWRWQINNSITGEDGLRRIRSRTAECPDRLRRVIARYPLRITPYYASLIHFNDPVDPLRRQVLPSTEELTSSAAGSADPFEEGRHMPAPGLIHRYRNRAVLLATDRCAVTCRHCTRKNTLGAAIRSRTFDAFREPLAYLRRTPQVREVIISGGDPLLLGTALLDRLLGAVQRIPHVDVVRLGTRAPVTLPMRVTPALCRMLAAHRPLWINTQFNHPAELTEASRAACDRLQQCGIPLSNQSVLLKGVNDDVATLSRLCNALQKNMIRPYYVFQCDPVAGTEHFFTEPQAGAAMEEELRNNLGGLALPRFVVDLPDSPGKTPLSQVAAGTRRRRT